MYLYIIECDDLSYYTGVATDIKKRLREHFFRLPGCARYTKSHKMKAPVAIWYITDKRTAYRLEYKIKQQNRTKKEELIEKPEQLNTFFGDILGTNDFHAWSVMDIKEIITGFNND